MIAKDDSDLPKLLDKDIAIDVDCKNNIDGEGAARDNLNDSSFDCKSWGTGAHSEQMHSDKTNNP